MRAIFIPVQFQDQEMNLPVEVLEQRVSDAQQYWADQYADGNLFTFELAPLVTLSKSIVYYGANYTDRKDVLITEAAKSACNSVNDFVDFSSYDLVGLICAGVGESYTGESDGIWPQYIKLSDFSSQFFLDGRTINDICITCESTGIIELCHEFGHYLGLPDFYDTDAEASGGLSAGLKYSALMDYFPKNPQQYSPPNLSAIEMEILDLGTCDTLKRGEYTLEPIDKSRRYLKALGTRKGEYYLIECRQASGRDESLGGSGLRFIHVDKSDADAGFSDYYGSVMTAYERWAKNQINNNPQHPCARLVMAVPESVNGKDAFFPRPGVTVYGTESADPFVYWNGESSKLVISNIKHRTDGSVSFEVIEPLVIEDIVSFQDAAIVSWSLDPILNGGNVSMTITWTDGEETHSADVDGGRQAYVLEGLKSLTEYEFTIVLSVDGEKLYSLNSSFSTKIYHEDTLPYIYLTGVKRNEDGSFPYGSKIPLRVFNVKSVASVTWLYNGKAIFPGPDGYYTIVSSGTLRARIQYSDGATEVIVKQINL
ncbi:MAG: hypothetical protein IIU68_06935 [Bacteroidales bacterium]|nr:hypothetical protein [Bacteroidales bacterium]